MWHQNGDSWVLNLIIDQHLMDNIECDHPNDCESCCSRMFLEWLDSNPTASWEDIIAAVDRIFTNGMFF